MTLCKTLSSHLHFARIHLCTLFLLFRERELEKTYHSYYTNLIQNMFFRICLRPLVKKCHHYNSQVSKRLKGHFCRILDFDLKPAQILENVPLTVLAKLSTGIDQIVYRYWPKRIPVLAKSYTAVGQMVY